ncbi:hybrid sensor histidine kinase/response regulator transcription factor [Polaribacter sp. SA4-12]|uniref:hybrid sensor histidine kinase/response regulator transcription factor n=1 Tax=Polaribacter sp. SA4-12 TaxID=1312072 RepID=UPI000B3CC25C|nr:two-component regulator propeller domain-containing protein [Polaribacter sp. SA4-12]ARV16509.1 hybrid sensor histidine kinase/response regulator [Polaribacter sp. SA4-12]
MSSSFLLKSLFQYVFLVFLFVGSVTHLLGQNSIHFQHITTEDGLSQSDINSMYQDEQGFMWFATHEGLNKYDGYSFKVFTPDANNLNSINSNLIFALTGDKKGNLWVGTTGKGLNYFDKTTEKFTHFTHDKKNKNSLINDHISSIIIDSKNRLWVGTVDGLDFVDLNVPLENIKFKHFNLDSNLFISKFGDNIIYSVFEDSKGDIWVGGFHGLFKLVRDSNGDSYFKLVNKMIGLPNLAVRSINEDAFGRLLIGSTNGFYLLDRISKVKVELVYSLGFTNNILIEKNTIWTGSNSGLYQFDNSNKNELPKLVNKFKYNPNNPSSLSKNIVKSLLKDKTGVIWVGTNGGGINKFDLERKQFEHIKKTLEPSSLSYDKIRSLYEDSNGALWVGTEGGGLNMLPKGDIDGLYKGFVKYPRIRKPFVTIEIKREGKKILLIGAEDSPGLYELDITNPNDINKVSIESFDGITGSVFALKEDTDKNLWVGTYSAGVNRRLYDTKTKTYKKDILANNKLDSTSISSDIIRNIIEDTEGNIWFATGNGLCRLDKDEKTKKHPKFKIYKNIPSNPKSISHNYILELFQSSNGDIWIGTLGGGLNKLVSSEDGSSDTFISYKIEDGLPNNVIKGILEDDKNNLWLSTNKGLSKFNPVNKTVKNFDVNDGLQSNEFQELARLKCKSGKLLFGGINGINSFYPEEIHDNPYEAETVITKLSISNEDVSIGEKVNGRVLLENSLSTTKNIKLKYIENSFSFEFSSLHFASPEKNKYAYKLNGFDNEWIYTSSKKRFATYTNLPPNNYTLMVKASNNDGVWDTTPSILNIEITPPFWLTNFAYFIYLLMVVGLLFLFRRFTIIGTREKHQLEIDHLETEKNDELQKIKFEFFTNISHELRTPLTLIKGPLKYLQKNGEKLNQNQIQEQYGLMEKNSDSLLRLVSQLLDFRKVNQGKMRLVMRKSNIVCFIQELCEPFQFLASKNQCEFNVTFPKEKIVSWFDHDAIEKIMNNLLSNAFKFTNEKGKVNVDIDVEEVIGGKHVVVIKVKDNGLGIDKEQLPNIFDRFYIDKSKQKSNPKGIGIGLSFVQQIVKLHQGSVDVVSELNKGATFIVKLPLEKDAYENIPELTCKSSNDTDFLVRTSETDSIAISINDEIVDLDIDKERSEKPVLLVVDDNEDIRKFLKQALSADYIIYEAENGKVGLDKANEIVPNIILTDVLMPEMDGIEFCNAVKSQKETSHIPVIMLTAKLSQESEIQGLKTGADDYIRKPFDIELLEVKLKNIIKYRDKLRKRFNKDISFKPKDVTVTTLDEKFLQQAIEIVEKHMMNTDFSVEMLVKEMGLSRSNLYLKFKEITGLSSSAFIRNIRLKRAVQLFEKSDYSVKEIMYMTGFNTASYFAKCFKKQFGVIPSEYVRQNVNNRVLKDVTLDDSFDADK